MRDRIIAVGLLSERDLEMLGRQFTRHFPLQESDDLFADLLEKLDHVTVKPSVCGQPHHKD